MVVMLLGSFVIVYIIVYFGGVGAASCRGRGRVVGVT